MVVVGTDAHKYSHTFVATDEVGRQLGEKTVLIIGQQGYTGGVNGITDLKTLLGWDIRTNSAKGHVPEARSLGP
nr:hypothetical protein [Mycobacterium tuberculosis]